MKRWIAAGAVAVAGAMAVRRGLRTMPQAFPPFAADVPPVQYAPVPADLPEPVARYLQVVAGDRLPLLNTAVITGRMSMRLAGPALPGRFRFAHIAAEGYRHYMEIVPFGRRVMTGQEWYLDGHARLDLPTGTVSDQPRIDQAANLSMWAEYVWLPSALVDPRVTWEAIDAVSARMRVPGDDTLVVFFDEASGLIDRLEALRWRAAGDDEPLRWVTRIHAWTRIDGIGVPAVASLQWGDQAQPWLKLSLDEVVWNADLRDYLSASGA
ncbi:MAG TPA: hypothetical protein PLT68_02625 [Actinomycetota bacterium]|nr:hypothetical protein [Actinomycetota bacterium]